MSKTKEELNALKKEVEAVNEKLQELTEDELEMVNGGTSVMQAIQGQAPGVQIASTDGQPGSRAKIKVRGGGSLNASNDPLYVVD